jgi:hypothetical protein
MPLVASGDACSRLFMVYIYTRHAYIRCVTESNGPKRRFFSYKSGVIVYVYLSSYSITVYVSVIVPRINYDCYSAITRLNSSHKLVFNVTNANNKSITTNSS